jgi:flagellar assembly protein FliH
MGKVIKGSTESVERYTVGIPTHVVPAPAYADDESFLDDVDHIASFAELDAPPEPAIDLEALHVQAREVIDEAARNAEALVDDAHQRARAVLEEATRRAREVADETRRAAQHDGYTAGVETAHAEMATMLDAMRELVEGARTERHGLITSAEPEIVKLAVGIAERVLHQQIALDRGVVVEMAKAAIARIVDREKITVRVNPADIERMRLHRDELLALGDVKTMRVIEDQRVDRGGVILETDAGSIDAKISTQLREVRKILHIVDDVVVQPAPAQDDALDDDTMRLSSVRAS